MNTGVAADVCLPVPARIIPDPLLAAAGSYYKLIFCILLAWFGGCFCNSFSFIS